jgi:nucleolar protein 56
LARLIADHFQYARVVKLIKNKSNLTDETITVSQLEEIVGDEAKAQEIIEAAKSSMGIYL